MVRQLVARVRASPREVSIELNVDALAQTLKLETLEKTDASITVVAKVRLTRTGRAVRLVHSDGVAATAGTPDPGLVTLLVNARRWWERIAAGEIDIATLSKEEGVNDSWMSRMIRIKFLSPRILEAILDGTQPAGLTARSLRRDDLPLDWDRQWEVFAS